MELKGLKVNFLGDSITEGYSASDMQKTSYWGLLKERDAVDARCYGIAGTRIARQQTPSDWKPFDEDFCKRALTMNPDADVVVVFGGTNDFGHGDAEIGSPEDRTSNTFIGACHVLCQELKERFPEAKIVFMTPLKRANEGDSLNEWGKPVKAALSEYVHIEKEVASLYGLEIVDLYEISGMNPADPELREKYNPDGLHPNDAGHELLYSIVKNVLKRL